MKSIWPCNLRSLVTTSAAPEAVDTTGSAADLEAGRALSAVLSPSARGPCLPGGVIQAGTLMPDSASLDLAFEITSNRATEFFFLTTLKLQVGQGANPPLPAEENATTISLSCQG